MLTKTIAYLKLMRFHRPIGIWLLLWPTLWALWIANEGSPYLKIVVIFILGTIVMRAAGCVINDIADRNLDGLVARTKERPLITGAVSVKEAFILFFILCVVALFLVLQLNGLTIALSVVGLLLAIIYPFTKRMTYWPQFFLGLAFAWAIPMAFAAQTDAVPNIAWWLFATTVLWSLVYDTMYAMTDREDDKRTTMKSTAILFGKNDRLIIALFQIVILVLLITVGLKQKLTSIYYLSLVIAMGIMGYQQYLIRNRDPQKCLQAFLNNSWFGAIVFLGLFLDYLSQLFFY